MTETIGAAELLAHMRKDLVKLTGQRNALLLAAKDVLQWDGDLDITGAAKVEWKDKRASVQESFDTLRATVELIEAGK